MKKDLKVISIIIAVLLVKYLSFSVYVKGLVVCNTTNIYIDNVSDLPTGYDWKSAYGLSESELKDMQSHPENYKEISMNCNAIAKVSFYDIGVACNKMKGICHKVRMALPDIPRMNLSKGNNEDIWFDFIIKYNGETDEEIFNTIKNSDFYLISKVGVIRGNWKITIAQDKFTPIGLQTIWD